MRTLSTMTGVALISALLTAGMISCATSRPPRDASEVEILYLPPERAYRVIAEFSDGSLWEEQMQQRAAEVGADAVIIEYSGGRGPAPRGLGENDFSTRMRGIAIRYGN